MHNPIAPLEVVATNETFVALCDDLDMSEAELADYRKTRDPSLIKLRDGREATRFVVKRLAATTIVALEGMSATMRQMMAFLMGCHLVRLPAGATHEPDPKRMTVGVGGVRIADDDWFNDCANRWGVQTCYEVGRVAFEWARLPEAAKGPFT